MKVVSSTLAMLLMAVIVVGLIGMVYFFISGMVGRQTTGVIQVSYSNCVPGTRIEILATNAGTTAMPAGDIKVFVNKKLFESFRILDENKTLELKEIAPSQSFWIILSSGVEGLILSYHFDEGEGTLVYDSSPNQNHGILYDANVSNEDGNTPPQWVDGKIGKALKFDGVDDYIEVTKPSQIDTNWTATVWVYLLENSPNKAHAFLDDSTWPSTSDHYSLRFSMHNTQTMGFTHYTIADYYFNYILPINEWKFVVFLGNSSGTYVYVDGNFVEFNTNTIKCPLKWIGHSPVRPFPHATYGILDEINVFNRTLNDKEIRDLYLHGQIPLSGKNYEITLVYRGKVIPIQINC